jgi:hypothetical protein
VLSFYCIVLLSTLFVSSCYWQPLPLDAKLSHPWADNITTFHDALNASMKWSYTEPFPAVMRSVERCWCDLSTGSFFEPFNVTKWEYLSVQKLKNELECSEQPVNQIQSRNITSKLSTTKGDTSMPRTAAPPTQTLGIVGLLANLRRARHRDLHSGMGVIRNGALAPSGPRREISLKPLGLEILIDYNWAR